jgi:hypothetical protein
MRKHNRKNHQPKFRPTGKRISIEQMQQDQDGEFPILEVRVQILFDGEPVQETIAKYDPARRVGGILLQLADVYSQMTADQARVKPPKYDVVSISDEEATIRLKCPEGCTHLLTARAATDAVGK